MSEQMKPLGSLNYPQWARLDDKGLARYVTPQSSRWLSLPINTNDLDEQHNRNRIIAKAIYDALVSKDINYALEAYHPSLALQTIRTPEEILISPKLGTCLDLATLFCGLCLAYELLPFLIVTNTHAFAAVSLLHGIRDWNDYRPERSIFDAGPLTSIEPLRDLVKKGALLPIECTGFAHSLKLREEKTKDVLTFDEAVVDGHTALSQAETSFRFAVDVAVAHYAWRMEPYPLQSLPGAWTTNIFRALSGAAKSLSDHLMVRSFERLVDERTAHFVGRDFVFKAIDNNITSPDFKSGYILIRGEPGIGKTSLLGQLVKTRGYIHHFNIAPQNIRSAKSFLESVCVQLIMRYSLEYVSLPPDSGRDSAFLSQILIEASKKANGTPIVILVDALDEAEDSAPVASNCLYLPPALPENVYFVATSRDVVDFRLDVNARRDIYLKEDDPKNVADIRNYIAMFFETNSLRLNSSLKFWNISEADFIDLLVTKSEGNFMYLVHVLNDMIEGRLSPTQIDNIRGLPQGLKAYYERHWRVMRAHNPQSFESVYEPVLRILATVREPVEVDDIHRWTGVRPARIQQVVREWHQFLNRELSNDAELFRIYHTSFRDFLATEGMGLKPSHLAIARAALSKIPGFFEEDS
jgi:hypothetical protein